MAQFRIEFVLDEASGKYLAELYNPENQAQLVARTEALYATQAAAVLGVVQLFRDAVLKPEKKAAGKPDKARAPRRAAQRARHRARRRRR